jgi:uncharacterized damage-inducible protein DinB
MKMLDDLRALFAFNRWANVRFLDALAGLSTEEYVRELGGSFPTMEKTLLHVFGAEWVWLSRWKGSSPSAFPDAEALDSVAAVRERWDRLWTEQREYLATLDEATLRGDLSYARMSGERHSEPLHEQLRHVVNHGTYHRGQLAMMLRMLGRVPPSTDLVLWYREGSGG